MSSYPTAGSSRLVMIDVQERLVPAMSGFEGAGNRIHLLLNGVRELAVPVIVTEQYPQGLGATLPEFSALLTPGTPVVAKSGFSVFGEPLFVEELEKNKKETLIFCGIESHVCVLQSVLDSLDAGYRTVVAADAVTSRKPEDRELALAQMRYSGALVASSEAILFMLLRTARHPAFKAVSKLVR